MAAEEILLLAAVLLGAIPSFGNAFIAAAVGYITEVTNDRSAFHKILLCLYIPCALVSWLQGRFDSTFDARFPAKQVQGFRVFFPAIVLILAYICLGAFVGSTREVDSAVAISFLALTGIIGFCSGSLLGSGSVLMEGIGTRQQVLIWIGISCAGLLCIATVYITGFTPQASPSTVRIFYFAGAGLLGVCTVVLGVMHLCGILDPAYEAAADPEEAFRVSLAPDSARTIPLSAWTIGANALMTVFCGPILPFVCYSLLSQQLILWKLSMDFLGPVSLLVLPNQCSKRVLVAMVVARVILLVIVLVLFAQFFGSKACTVEKATTWLVLAWDVFMLLGAMLSCFCDTYAGGGDTPLGRSAHRIRWNRVLYYAGICLGLLGGGVVILFFHQAQALGNNHSSFSASCSRCAKPDRELGGLRRDPCSATRALDGEGSVLAFHYGANMGCAKLGAIDVKPISAKSAYLPGWCLRFGSAEGVPTSSEEPAFGSIAPCGEGCVHGVVHELSTPDLAKIQATEPGYYFAEVSGLIGYDGEHIPDVKAYIMRKRFTDRAPSRRYAGLVYCEAKASLATAYAQQLACELGELGIHDLDCGHETFTPLNATEE